METLGIILIIYGAFVLFGTVMKFPLFFSNPKAKGLKKLLGDKGYLILLYVFGLAALVIGILLV